MGKRGQCGWLGLGRRRLIFKREYGEDILRGGKTLTIRLYSPLKSGDTVDIVVGPMKVGTALIESVEVKKVKDLTDNDAIADGFTNRDELLKALKKIYKSKISDRTEVKLIKFKLLGRGSS
ncbi:MAG: ASCH domain-containing protein [Thermoprotei archaeon]|nr:MAG: ASCH domain-containing protein [Thermoprotei archaeon]